MIIDEKFVLTEEDLIEAINSLPLPVNGLVVYIYPWLWKQIQQDKKLFMEIIPAWASWGVKKIYLNKPIKDMEGWWNKMEGNSYERR